MGVTGYVADVVGVFVAVTIGVNADVKVAVGEHTKKDAPDIAPWLSMAVFTIVPEFDVTCPTHAATPLCPGPRGFEKVQFMTPALLLPLPLIDTTFI